MYSSSGSCADSAPASSQLATSTGMVTSRRKEPSGSRGSPNFRPLAAVRSRSRCSSVNGRAVSGALASLWALPSTWLGVLVVPVTSRASRAVSVCLLDILFAPSMCCSATWGSFLGFAALTWAVQLALVGGRVECPLSRLLAVALLHGAHHLLARPAVILGHRHFSPLRLELQTLLREDISCNACA